jgi:hypothetical protein
MESLSKIMEIYGTMRQADAEICVKMQNIATRILLNIRNPIDYEHYEVVGVSLRLRGIVLGESL